MEPIRYVTFDSSIFWSIHSVCDESNAAIFRYDTTTATTTTEERLRIRCDRSAFGLTDQAAVNLRSLNE